MTDGGKKKENNGGRRRKNIQLCRYPMGPTIIRYGPFWAAV